MKMKYVMTNHGPIIFPETIPHDAFRSLHSANAGRRLLSAGFVHGINAEEAECYGESETLKMQAHNDDTKKLRDALNPYLN